MLVDFRLAEDLLRTPPTSADDDDDDDEKALVIRLPFLAQSLAIKLQRQRKVQFTSFNKIKTSGACSWCRLYGSIASVSSLI
jgi:hypothetical protein